MLRGGKESKGRKELEGETKRPDVLRHICYKKAKRR